MIITLPQLDRALYQVNDEMAVRGFLTPKVSRYDVILEPIAFTYTGICHSDGEIRIPALSALRFADWIMGSSACSLRDVLRHEFAHAMHFSHPRLVCDQEFRDTYFDAPYCETLFVSEYAATEPCEDFAETFMYFLKHKGHLPRRFNTRGIRRKWRFIEKLSRRMARRFQP